MDSVAARIYNQAKKRRLRLASHYRIIPSHYPPINFFENLVSADLMEEVFYLESLTNERLRDQVGDISLVRPEDRIAGEGSSVVMAAFTHPTASRFSAGDFGIYYAAKTLATAIKETIYHREQFLSQTNEPAGIHTQRVYVGRRILEPLIDIRSEAFNALHHPTALNNARAFGEQAKQKEDWGIHYQSVRDTKGECLAIFRPKAIELPIRQAGHLQYHWDGKKITHVVQLGAVIFSTKTPAVALES